MTRQEAIEFIKAFVKLRSLAADEVSLQVPNLYPTWRENATYALSDRVLYNGTLYKVLQAHTAQPDWTPDVAVSLFAKVLIPDENVISEWVQPDSTNPYMTGDKVYHNGKTWVSIVDNNVWSPDAYGWEEV
jgi:chitodextrinase